MLHHELRRSAALADKEQPIYHYSVGGSFDVDFLVQTRPKTLSAPCQFVAIEAQLGGKFKPQWIRGLRTLLQEYGSRIRRGIVVSSGKDRLKSDGIDIMPAALFLERLHAGRIV